MPALAHLGIGFAAKGAAPKLPVWALIMAAFGPDLIAISLFFLPKITWFHHGLIMAIVWSLLGISLTFVVMKHGKKDQNISRNTLIFHCLFIGLLVFSHWILDFIGWPMTAIDPTATGIPLFFNDFQLTGLGLYSNIITAVIVDLGTCLIGILIYVYTLKKLKSKQ